MNSNDAANLFMDALFYRCYLLLYPEMIEKLIPDGGLPQADDPAALSSWYMALDTYNKKMVNETIRNTIIATVLYGLPILDNIVGSPVKGVLSDFALYLQTYTDKNAYLKDIPREAIRVNSFNNPDYESLESLFLSRLEDHTTG
jgi:hypothetical protein